MKRLQQPALVLLLLLMAAVGSALAQDATFLDVSYVVSGDDATASPAQTLDLYVPSGPPAPLVVFVHGGGWRQGDKAVGRRVADTFTAEGFGFASVNYRLLPEGTVADMVTDIADAIAFLQENARDYNLDPSRLGLMGHSAGGHLAALVSSGSPTQAVLPKESIRALVLLDGVAFDVENGIPRNRGLLRAFGEDPAKWAALSPVARVLAGAELPPVFIAYGLDRPDTAWQACRLAQVLAGSGRAPILARYDKSHGRFLLDLRETDDPLTADVLAFLQATLVGTGMEPEDIAGVPANC